MNLAFRILTILVSLIAPAFAQNLALGRPITASAAVWGGLPVTNAVDGNFGSLTHPLANSGTLGFYYQIDLGADVTPSHISVVNRGDGCCPERLTNYQVSLLADSAGSPGAVLWQATIRGDGSNSGIGGTDLIFANASSNPAHTFRGRFLRLSNLSNAAYNPQLAEIQVWQLNVNGNLALGRPTIASGVTYPGYPAGNLTDGNRLSPGFSHPETGAGFGFYYQTDLGVERALSRIVLYNRDNAAPERLSNYRVTLFANNGTTVNWQADIRTDGSNSGLGGADTILKTASTNPAHIFFGRYIRVTNISGAAYNPQIAELEAYPEPSPTIRYFLTSAGNIGAGLPSSATLSWSVTGADSVSINNGVGPVATTGSVVVAPGAGTVFTLTAVRAGATDSSATVTIAVGAATLQPKITEFSAGGGLLEDENGDREDWIEIENPNPYTLNLAGYYLTDASLVRTKWQFPLSNIAPNGRTVVFASGKDRAIAGSQLHTNFSLAGSGEYLALVAPNGTTVVQQFPADFPLTATFPAQSNSVTYGLDGAGNARYFKPATPGAPNGTGYDGVVADTTFNVKRGFFSTPQSVAISTTTASATIRYTTNNTEPTEATGTLYTTPLSITTTTVLRAAAFRSGYVPTNVDTNTYIFPAVVVASPVMSTTITGDPTYGPQMQAALLDIPSISIVTPATIGQDSAVGCSFEYIPVGAPLAPGEQENGGIELFGGEFTNFQKKSFRVSFSADYGATRVSIPSLFTSHARGWKPVGKFDQLELRSGSHDMAQRGFYMSNIFTDGTMLDMGAINPHSRFVHMYLNGEYRGMFQLRERWGADMLTSYIGGPTSDHESINGNYNVGGWATPGEPYDGDGSSWTRIQNLRTNYSAVKPYLDVQHYVDYMLMFMFGHSEDEYRTTGPKDVGSGFKWFLNDADGYLPTASYLAGQPVNSVALRSNPSAGRQRGDGPGSVFSQLWQGGDVDYRMLLADRIHKHLFNGGALTSTATNARLTAMCSEISRAFYAESARWLSSNETTSPATWISSRDYVLNTWMPGRSATYLAQLQSAGYYPSLAAPAFAGSGTINFPVAGATVLYTTNGSDPRLPGGAQNPTAIAGSSFIVTQNTWLRARAISGATWSALNEAFYPVSPLASGDVVLSEIHFNPAGDDDTEFVELLNPTSHAVNLRGAKFNAGISYDFPDNRDIPLAPGGRLVLVANQYAFQKRYGIAIPVGGVYFDRLGNDGDTLTLSSGATTITTLQYQDIAPWPDSADGDGYSLVLTNINSPTSPNSYRTSIAANGTPGTGDALPAFSGTLLADSDSDGLPAMVEHFLATSDSVNNTAVLIPGRSSDGRAMLTFPRKLGADDLIYVVEVSTDLASWSPAATRTLHTNHGNGTATETWVTDSVATRQFLRLRVVRP